MHIQEAVLSVSPEGTGLLCAGVLFTAAGTAWALRQIDYERIPRVAMFSATFFVISLIHVPLGTTSVHLVLNGLAGLILGWAVFPAFLIALLLQVLFFGFGGLTTLGINTLIMALPAVVCYYIFRSALHSSRESVVFLVGFTGGVFAFLLAAMMHASVLLIAGREYAAPAYIALGVHVITALVEGAITGSAVVFLRKVRPELLDAPLLTSSPVEVSHG